MIGWVVARPDYDEYEVVAIFTDKASADELHRELDCTLTGKHRGKFSVDPYPLNPASLVECEEVADVLC